MSDDARSSLETWVRQSWQRDAAVVPAFPLVATRLVDALEHPDTDIELVQEILAQDASITAQVIRAANSAYYRGVSNIEDLRSALMRLGFRETANVAMAVACRSLFAVEDRAELEVFPELWSELWESSIVGAYGARLVAAELKLGDPRRAFLGSMFRDIGCLVMLKLVASGLVNGRLRDRPSMDELEPLFAAIHQPLGAAYLRRFEMPDYVIEVVEQHHASALPFEHRTVVTHVVRLVDGLCDRLEIGPFARGTIGPDAEHSVELLGVDEQRVEYFALQLESVREQIRDVV